MTDDSHAIWLQLQNPNLTPAERERLEAEWESENAKVAAWNMFSQEIDPGNRLPDFQWMASAEARGQAAIQSWEQQSTSAERALADVDLIADALMQQALSQENDLAALNRPVATSPLDIRNTGFACVSGPGSIACVDVNKEVYVGGNVGTPGVNLGVAPKGVSAYDHLTGTGATVITPQGVGVTVSGAGVAPTVGTSGIATSVGVISLSESIANATTRIITEVKDWAVANGAYPATSSTTNTTGR
jgi:hypothetical protein